MHVNQELGSLPDPSSEATETRPEAVRYWLVHSNGCRQWIDPRQFDLDRLAERARLTGGRLVAEREAAPVRVEPADPQAPPRRFEPPISALGPLFLARLERIYTCQSAFGVDINTRATSNMLGGYYKGRRLVRVYTHDRQLGRRPLEELFDTFLHEVAHHIEYTEPDSYHARECGRVPGRMHSRLFWRILGDLKARWIDLQNQG